MRRVKYCDSGQKKLLWAEMLKRATAPEPGLKPQRWWQIAIAFLDRVWL